jgi:hypothetical protein
MDAFESISHNHLDPSEKQVDNITSWWAENTEGVVDPKSFNELLVDTGNFLTSLIPVSKYPTILVRTQASEWIWD